MNKEQVLGIVRHLLTALGGYLIATGAMEETLVAEATGAVLTLAGVVWSVVAKNQPAA
jgi:hypothetical protein